MILKPYASALGAVDDSGDGSGSDSGSTWSGLSSVLNSGAATGVVSGIFSLFGGKSNTGTHSGTGYNPSSSSGTSPFVYIGAGVLGIGALALLLRKKRR